MGLVITKQEEIDKYFDSDALSQSSLKKLLGGIGNFLANKEEEKKLFYEEKGHFIIGSAVDMLLTGEKEEFNKTYYTSELIKKPSDTEMSILQMIFHELSSSLDISLIEGLEIYPDSIAQAVTEHNWQPKWKEDTKINKIIEVGKDYFEDLKKGFGKQILTTEEKKLIDDIVFSLRSNKITSKYFDRVAFSKNKNVDIYYQLPIYFYYKGIYCKALLDILIVEKDDKGKIISVHPIDLKTMNGSTLRFLSNLKSFRYDIQAAWYIEGLLASPSSFELEGLIKKEHLKPFTFIVESNSNPGQPLIYETDDEIINAGKYGRKDLKVKLPGNDYEDVVVRNVVGFDELINTYIYQTENDWTEEEVITKNEGVLKIGWNGIK